MLFYLTCKGFSSFRHTLYNAIILLSAFSIFLHLRRAQTQFTYETGSIQVQKIMTDRITITREPSQGERVSLNSIQHRITYKKTVLLLC